jgi:glutathione S-transferase
MIELWREWNSVQSFKVRVALAEKDLERTALRVELLKFEHLQSEYLCLNPNGVVPTLVHDGKVVLESCPVPAISLSKARPCVPYRDRRDKLGDDEGE